MKEIFLRHAREARHTGACWHAEAVRTHDEAWRAHALAMRAMCHANAARYWRYAQGRES